MIILKFQIYGLNLVNLIHFRIYDSGLRVTDAMLGYRF